MASLNQMEIGNSLVRQQNIELRKSLFGIIKKLIYLPTGEKIKLNTYEYTPDKMSKIERTLKADSQTLKQIAEKEEAIEKAPTSNLRLEIATTESNSFAAVQLFRFADFQYQPVTEIRYCEGDDAKLIIMALLK